MDTISTVLADFIGNVRFERLPAPVIAQARLRVLDLVGVAFAGYASMEFPRLVVSYFADLGGKPEATLLQTRVKVPALNAALGNAVCAHAIDMDDGHRFAALHPGTVVIPAALAAAERTGATGCEFLAGIVAGYEVMIRVGAAINPSSLKRGFHATGIAGSFGAAAAAANILRLSPDQTVNALGLAGLQAGGLLQVNHELEGAKSKPINPGRAAASGLLSSILAQKGASGPLAIFEGEDGFLKAFADQVHVEVLTRDLGQTYEIENAYDKLYAACRHAHACIDAALEAQRRGHVDPRTIKNITVETYAAGVRLAGIAHPPTPSAARFSIPFSVALALLKQDASADKFSETNVADAEIQALADRVDLVASEVWERVYPNQRGATVTLVDGQDRVWRAEVGLAKGEPENPASWDELYAKFLANATTLVSEPHARRLGDVIRTLDSTTLLEFVALI